MDINAYLAERRKRYPTAARLLEKQRQAEALKEAGVLQNAVSPADHIQRYENFMKGKQVAVRRAKRTVADFLGCPAQHAHNSLLLEALTFISRQAFLQEGIPEEFRFTYESTWVSSGAVSAPASQEPELQEALQKLIPAAVRLLGSDTSSSDESTSDDDWLASSSSD